MSIRHSTIAALALALVVGGCSSSEAPVPEPEPEPTTSTTAAPTPVPTLATAADDALAACARLFDGQSQSLVFRIPDALLGIGDSMDAEASERLLTIHYGLEEAAEVAPVELAARITALDVPFQQLADVVAAGGGSLEMDTSRVAGDVLAVMEECVDAGYQVPSERFELAEP